MLEEVHRWIWHVETLEMICRLYCSLDQIVRTDKSTCKDSFLIMNM